MREVFLDKMSWKDAEKAASDNDILILVVGSTEQHGLHLPLGTDVFIPLGLAERVARRVNAVIVPPITYGYYSQPRSGGGGEKFAGTTSVSSSTLVGLVSEIMVAFLRHGFQRFLVMIGHYENSALISEGIERAIRHIDNNKVRVLITSYWDLIPKEIIEKVYPEGFPGWEVEHAAIAETSIMLALRPELVKTENVMDDMAKRKLPYDIIPPPEDIIPKTGLSWRASLASKDKGEILIGTVVDKMIELIGRDLA